MSIYHGSRLPASLGSKSLYLLTQRDSRHACPEGEQGGRSEQKTRTTLEIWLPPDKITLENRPFYC